MMKRIIYKTKAHFLALMLMSLILVACDDFFELKPHDMTPTEDILTNLDDARTMMNGIYALCMSGSSYGKNLTVLPDIMTDAAFAATGFSNQLGLMYQWNVQPGSGEVAGLWSNHYAGLYNANFLINNIDQLEDDGQRHPMIKGEAYAARALLHYNLVRFIGKAYDASTSSTDLGVPYMTDNSIGSPQRTSVQKVYDQMIADLEMALSLLPDNDTPDYHSFSNHFVHGLLARIYLDMHNYSKVLEHTNTIIDSDVYRLLSGEEYANMWLKDIGDEIIWKVEYTNTDYGSAPGYNFGNRNSDKVEYRPDYIPADWLLNLYNRQQDVRFNAFFTDTTTQYGWRGYLITKYPTNPNLPFFDGRNMPKPMRLSEIYLMKAEAHANIPGEGEQARTALEAILKARIRPDYDLDINDDGLMDFIRIERIRELIFEGFYFHDLKRFNLGFERVPQANTGTANDLKIEPGDYRWQWPIPTSELNGNKVITQNDGY